MKEYLTDLEIAKIETFCADTEMYEAVKKVVLAGLYHNGVIIKGESHDAARNFALALVNSEQGDKTDAQIGQELRAAHTGISLLLTSFNELRNIKRDDNRVESPINMAI